MSKNVIITGASGNLGKATVEKFIEEGFHVIATVSPGKTLGYETSGSLEIFEVDLTNEVGVTQFIEKVFHSYGSIDSAVLLVGAFATGSIEQTTGDSIRKMMALNFETAYLSVRPIFGRMLNQGHGRIILIGARPALRAEEGISSVAYALSKSLIFKLAELLNANGAKQNVITHVIVPGTMDTPSNRAALPAADHSNWVQPGDVARTIHQLASDQGKSFREGIFKMYGNS